MGLENDRLPSRFLTPLQNELPSLNTKELTFRFNHYNTQKTIKELIETLQHFTDALFKALLTDQTNIHNFVNHSIL